VYVQFAMELEKVRMTVNVGIAVGKKCTDEAQVR
jgi:hypothetical protein